MTPSRAAADPVSFARTTVDSRVHRNDGRYRAACFAVFAKSPA